MQSVPITTEVTSSNPAHSEVYSIQLYVIKFISDLRQVSGFLTSMFMLSFINPAIVLSMVILSFIDPAIVLSMFRLSFIDPAIVLSMFMLSFMFVIVCGL